MQTPVVTVVCTEPEGVTVRNVYPMQLTPENIRIFWEKSKNLKTVFAGEITGDFQKFAELFISQEGDEFRSHGLFWVVDDFTGVFYLNRITDTEAYAHYLFFDRRHLGRHELAREMMRFAFRKFGFWRLNVEIPLYASAATFEFVRSIGFKKEGRKRNAVLYRDRRYDVICFGQLREEALSDGGA